MAWQRERWAATAGLTFDRWHADQSWRGRGLIYNEDIPFQFAGDDALTGVSAIATAMLAPRGRFSAGGHARVWLVDGQLFPAPGVWVSARITPSLTAQVAVERRFQFEAELGEPEFGIGRAPVFLLRDPREARSAGVQLAWTGVPRRRELGDSTGGDRASAAAGPLQLRAQAFVKQYRAGVGLPERPIVFAYEAFDTTTPPEFPHFNRIDGRSYGFMVGGRVQPHRRLFLEGGYTYQRALEKVDHLFSPTVWDAPHQVSGFASVLLTRKWTLNASGQARSGLPQTGIARRVIFPRTDLWAGQRWVPGPRNGVQLPAYYRLDAGVRRTSSDARVAWTFNFQLLNLLFKRNATAYYWPQYFCAVDPAQACGSGFGEPIESFSLPIVPSFGFEFRW
jgi:hypothetical protein